MEQRTSTANTNPRKISDEFNVSPLDSVHVLVNTGVVDTDDDSDGDKNELAVVHTSGAISNKNSKNDISRDSISRSDRKASTTPRESIA